MMIAKEDEMEGANADVSRLVYDQINSPKEIIEIDGGHFGLLHYPGTLFDNASMDKKSFLKLHFQ